MLKKLEFPKVAKLFHYNFKTMDKEIKLQRATFDDIPIILEVEKSVIGTKIYSGLTGAEDAKTELTNDIYYLIKMGDKVVGDTSYKLKDDDSAYISGLVVSKEFQGQGVAKKQCKYYWKC